MGGVVVETTIHAYMETISSRRKMENETESDGESGNFFFRFPFKGTQAEGLFLKRPVVSLRAIFAI